MTINVDESAVKRIEELRARQEREGEDEGGESAGGGLFLRVTVEGGGCSGFQYRLELTGDVKDRDLIFANAVVTDDVSLNFLKDSTIRFDESLIGAEFKIDNPNAVSGCGCGTSFAV